jgi:hypothetical protein
LLAATRLMRKELAALPPRESAGDVMATPPVFVTVNVWEPLVCPTRKLPKVWVFGVMASAPGATPVPSTLAPTMPPVVALAVKVPVRAPNAAGLNRSVTEQFSPGVTSEPQVFDATVNSGEGVAVNIGKLVGASPLFETPMVAVTLVPVATDPKLTIGVDNRSCAGASPRPVNTTVAGTTPVPETVRRAFRGPGPRGLNCTATEQVPPPATIAP